MSAMTTLPVVSDMLNKNLVQIRNALPNIVGLSAERLVRVALTEFSKNPRLRECTPISFCSAVIQAAQMGLEFGELKHCALVPYKDECKLMVQYQGWIALLWRSGAVRDVQARVVYEGDEFDVLYGSESKLIHVPRFKSSTPMVYWAGATPVHGKFMFEVMTFDHVEAHKKQYARGLDKKDSPWNTSFDSMALKTVLRKLIKLMNLSADSPLIAATAADDKIWMADKEEARMDKFHAIHAATDLPSEPEKVATLKAYDDFLSEAKAQKVDVSDLPLIKDANDVNRLHAVSNIIAGRLKGHAPVQESTYE